MYRSKATVKVYRYCLAEFFKSVYGKNENHVEEYGDKYFMEKRNVQEDIQKFLVDIKDKPPKTVRLMLAAVRSFLIENDVELPAKFWRRLRLRVRGNRALTLDKVPSVVELRRVMMHLPIQGKAFYLMLSSSGMRIGEAMQLTPEDIEFDKTPCQINIQGKYTKTGNSRVAFMSSEAKEAIEEWLKVRTQYLGAAIKKSHTYKKKSEDSRIFPFEANTSYAMWTNALKKAGYFKRDLSTNRATVHPHVLRKFFRTRLGAVIPVDIAEALMGHEQYLTEVYRRYTTEDLAKFYLQGEPALLVFMEAEEVVKLRVEVEDRNKQLQSLVNGLSTENMDLKQRIIKTEQKLGELEKLVRQAIEQSS
jgi:integrase